MAGRPGSVGGYHFTDDRVVGVVEEHRHLGGEVAKECHVGNSDGGRDLFNRDGVVAAGGEQPHRCFLETSLRLFCSRHETDVSH